MRSASNYCYLCSSTKYKLLHIVNNYNIVICSKCHFIYTHYKMDENKYNSIYENFDYSNPIENEIIIRKDAIRSINNLLKQNLTSKKLIDIGCGRGYFLDEARKKGFDVYGIDLSNKVIKYAKDVLKLHVLKGNFNKITLVKKFDICVLNQVIEHTQNPKLLIKSCKKILNKNGLIYIATPNIDSLLYKIMGKKYEYFLPPEHLGYYNKKSLTYLLENNNFKILSIKYWSYPSNFAGITKKILVKENKPVNVIKIKQRNNFTLKIKHFIFDIIFAKTFYSLLNYRDFGTNIEIIASKNN